MSVSISAVALILAACGVDSSGDAGVADSVAPDTTQATSTTVVDLEVEEPMPDESELVNAAIADLASRLNVSQESVEVVRAGPVEWPDGSLGCPEEGMSYTQAVVEGTEVLLGSDGRVYMYHAGPDGSIFLCPSDEKDGGYEFVPSPGFDD